MVTFVPWSVMPERLVCKFDLRTIRFTWINSFVANFLSDVSEMCDFDYKGELDYKE